MTQGRKCMANATAFQEPCQGDLWEARAYFVSGASLYYCERHARESMRGNPFGARFKPQSVIQKRKDALKDVRERARGGKHER